MPLSKEQIAEMQAKAAARKGNFSSGDIPKFYPKKKDVLTGRFVPDSDLEIVRAVCEHKNARTMLRKSFLPFHVLRDAMCARKSILAATALMAISGRPVPRP